MELQQIEKLLKYYNNSEIRVTNDMHPHFNAVGDVIGGEESGLKIKRFDTQQIFLVQAADIKITKRK
ncbi:hypothetical protein ACTJKC_24910 [Pedobacter sp. 22226]|uniref:hypothetical protein n=1 Tax=Pedobacter sp. 22226 TaxID=3453894 RepID=UPI003F856F5B